MHFLKIKEKNSSKDYYY